VALAGQGNGLESDQHSYAQKSGHVNFLRSQQTATMDFFTQPIARIEHEDRRNRLDLDRRRRPFRKNIHLALPSTFHRIL
jgi:hypothetical protein